jgi:hypothetical protein
MYLFSCIRFYSDFYLLLHDGMLDTLVTEVTLPVFLYHYDGPIYIQYLCTVEAYR